MLKKLAMAIGAAAFLASPAFAAPAPEKGKTLSLELAAPPAPQGLSDVVAVETGRPAAAVIATDALYGGIAGAAIGLGVALINGNNYPRDIMVGAGIGLIAGGVIGAVDVAANGDRLMMRSEGTNAMNKTAYGVGGKF